MEPEDKFLEQIKKAAENESPEKFAAMESVWLRVETRLDNTALKRQNRTWKKWAVAASLLLCGSIAWQMLKTETPQPRPVRTKVVEIEKPVPVRPADTVITSAHLKPEAPQLLEKAIGKGPAAVAANESPALAFSVASPKSEEIVEKETVLPNPAEADDALTFRPADRSPSAEYAVPDARQQAPKQAPLLVLNEKAMTAKTDREIQKKINSELSEKGQPDSVTVLTEPLYIINGVEYTEESLFGTHPTSPYAPLNRQDIESISVLQHDQAMKSYGKKGEKGVVIIATKGGKPAVKK